MHLMSTGRNAKGGGNRRAAYIVATLHAGFHCGGKGERPESAKPEFGISSNEALTVPGWKSDIEKQIFLSG